MGMSSKTVREKLCLGITQKEFAERFGIPLRTVQNWDSRECMPDYVAQIIHELVLWRDECFKLRAEIIRRDLE